MSSSESDEEYFLSEYEQICSNDEFCQSCDSNDDDDPQLSFEFPNLEIQESESPVEGSKKRGISANSASAKRLRVWSNHGSKPTKECTTVKYIGEIDGRTSLACIPVYNMSAEPPRYFTPGKEWEKRTKFDVDRQFTSQSGLQRSDLYLFAIEANKETTSQVEKPNGRRCLPKLTSPIERFYTELWNNESHALKVIRTPENIFTNVPLPIHEPFEPLHPQPPHVEHCLSEEGKYLLDSENPIDFFEALFRKYEFVSLLNKIQRFRKQKHFDRAPYNYAIPTYEEIKCFVGLLLWTSLVPFPNRRSYFTNSEIYDLPNFKKHVTRDRFEELLKMLHLTDNEQIEDNLIAAKRFEAKMGNFLSSFNANSKRLLAPARSLSIDEMMVKFYGRSVIRQYIKSKPTKYGVKLWSICCSCCGYSLTQNIYLGSTVEKVGGRDVVLQLTEPYLDKGHVKYCDRFFSHLDIAAYLRSRKTGMVGTSNLKSLPADMAYLVHQMHPLTWVFKWFQQKADIKYKCNGTNHHVQANEPVSIVVWMDKKYRSDDKKVVFIHNCLPSIPSEEFQLQQKNIRDEKYKYHRQPITSSPILKAYNNRMGGVDRHDRLVGHHLIKLSSKRGYIKVFFHLLDSVVVNAWILFKTARKMKGCWKAADERRYTLAWFKENIIISLCGNLR
ncbi:piggyBac-derived 2-like [Oopsacas minuta]|uniref:PiggyBac-derived 2-like n=1 Tax=Oopsacas minuta TaxID=111878 RepID=A0AAV7JE86_9METZ|nr:piggyBac-derived 2-like [Oopsacas minuta]